jgi:hypothetical protein
MEDVPRLGRGSPIQFEEADLQSSIRLGGTVAGALVVERRPGAYVVYLRASWIRGRAYGVLRTWRGHGGDRVFKSLDVVFRFVRRFGFTGRVTVYPAGDPELAQFSGVLPEDRFGPSGGRKPGIEGR